MRKKNPLIDYEDVWDEEDEGMNAKPLPVNLIFPGAADIDPRIAGDEIKNNEFGDNGLFSI